LARIIGFWERIIQGRLLMSRCLGLVCVLACLIALPAAAEVRIAFVNSETILQEYSAVQQAMETFNRDVEGWQQELALKTKELEDLQKEIDQQSMMLSDERRQEKELEYQRRSADFEKLKESIWSPDGLVEQRNEELMRPIVNRIQAVLEQIATEDGYDLVLDAADSNVLFGDPSLDLTRRVIDALNAGATGTTTDGGTESSSERQ
jgi:outer membrane protein